MCKMLVSLACVCLSACAAVKQLLGTAELLHRHKVPYGMPKDTECLRNAPRAWGAGGEQGVRLELVQQSVQVTPRNSDSSHRHHQLCDCFCICPNPYRPSVHVCPFVHSVNCIPFHLSATILSLLSFALLN